MPGLFTDPSCTEQHRVQAGDVLALTSPVEEDGVTLFRRTLYLQIFVDQQCNAIALSPDSQFGLRYEPATVSISRTDSDWVQRWTVAATKVDVELRYPAPILRMHSQLYGTIKVYRVDGEAVSEQPTVTAGSGQAFPEPLVAPAFQVALSAPVSGRYAAAMANMVRERHARAHQSLSALATAEHEYRAQDQDLLDIQHEVMVRSGLGSIALQGQATNPRLRLLSADSSETLWQWLEDGTHAGSVAFPRAEETLAGLLEPALKRAFELHLQERDEKTEPYTQDDLTILLPLLVESDAPCHVEVDQANPVILLETGLLEKPVTWSFDGSRRHSEVLPLTPPAGTPRSLVLEGNLDLLDTPWQSTPPPLVTNTELTGVNLSRGEQIAVPFTVEVPLRLGGLAIAWYGLAARADLKISLSHDSDNRPAARVCTEGALTTTGSAPEWLHFRMHEVALQPGLYWIQLQLLEGNGIWLGEALDPAGRIWRSRPGQAMQPEPLALALHSQPLLRAAEQGTAAAPPELSLDGIVLTHEPVDQNDANRISGELTPVPPALQSLPEWVLTISCTQSTIFSIKSLLLRYSP